VFVERPWLQRDRTFKRKKIFVLPVAAGQKIKVVLCNITQQLIKHKLIH